MSVLNKNKQLILDKISATQTIANEKIPNLSKYYESGKKIKESPIDFLVSLFRRTIGIDELLNTLNNIIYDKLSFIEIKVKDKLYININNILTCALTSEIYDSLFDKGINIDVGLVDIINTFRVDPESPEGNIIYGVEESEDLNKILFNSLKTPNQSKEWKEILIITYKEGVSYDNLLNKDVFNVKLHPKYKSNNNTKKTIKDVTKEIINNITLFNKKDVIGRLFDNIFNVTSSSIKKSIDQLLIEEEVNELIKRIIESETEFEEDSVIIDDSFFEFSNSEYNNMLNQTNKKLTNGFSTSSHITPQIECVDLIEKLHSLKNDATLIEQKKTITNIITSSFDSEIEYDVNDVNKTKTNVIVKLITELCLTIVNSIISPKVMLVILYNMGILSILTNELTKRDIIKYVLKLIEPIIIEIKNLIMDYISDEIVNYFKQLAIRVGEQYAKDIANSIKLTIKSLTPIKL